MTKSERLKVRLKTVHIAWQVSGDTRHFGWPVPHPPSDNGFRGYTLASVILIRRLKMSDTCSWKARFCAARTVQVRGIRSLVASRRVGYDTIQSRSRIICSVRIHDAAWFRKLRIEDLIGSSIHVGLTLAKYDTDFIGISSAEFCILTIG